MVLRLQVLAFLLVGASAQIYKYGKNEELAKMEALKAENMRTARPTRFPTVYVPPTKTPTMAPTIDTTRVIKTCAELSSSEVTWYSETTGQICSGNTPDESCKEPRRCLLESSDGNGKKFTSTCSHVHCKVEQTDTGRKFTQVHHHHKEKYGTMHICQMNLHRDYVAGEHCGCECFVELAGDNDWLTGLAKRALKHNKSPQTPTKNLLVHKRVAARNYYGNHDGKTASGTGYKNHEGVTMFKYKNQV